MLNFHQTIQLYSIRWQDNDHYSAVHSNYALSPTQIAYASPLFLRRFFLGRCFFAWLASRLRFFLAFCFIAFRFRFPAGRQRPGEAGESDSEYHQPISDTRTSQISTQIDTNKLNKMLANCYPCRRLLSHSRRQSAAIAQELRKVKSRDTDLFRTSKFFKIC